MGKGPGVQKMFDAIAGRYDLMNRVMTFGQDQRWRKFVVECAGNTSGGRVLDLATGTGDIAALFCTAVPGTMVFGADFSKNMLAEAAKRFCNYEISWQACDANYLPYRDNSFQTVTFGYLLRNVDDSSTILHEVRRVLVPGGNVVCLDTTPPKKTWHYPMIRLYLKYGIPLLGRMVARDDTAYSYLIGSTMDFHDAKELARLFEKAGFKNVGYKKFMLGTIAIHWGVKE